jgi:dihydropteroate synthase
VIWSGCGFHFDLSDRSIVMGIVNATPDSFSDGGQFATSEDAIAFALAVAEQGAAIVDIGGESTRPGSDPVTMDEELARVLPIIERLREKSDVAISIDTMKPEVARRAIEAGANIVNDVSALSDPEMAPLVAETGAGLVLMHMQGRPKTMQETPEYGDVIGEVGAFLSARAAVALDAGIPANRIAIDPGIGFGKTLEHNLAIFARLDELAALGYPLLIGPSRKRFIGELTGAPVGGRLAGTVAAITAGVARGARIARVHDVAAAVQALRVADAIGKASN